MKRKINPEGIESFSPALRGMRYAGFARRFKTTLKGLNKIASKK
jgi:hypothetical protein